jgi:hypothetical protein
MYMTVISSYPLYHTNLCSYSDFVCSGMIFVHGHYFTLAFGEVEIIYLISSAVGVFLFRFCKVSKEYQILKFNEKLSF